MYEAASQTLRLLLQAAQVERQPLPAPANASFRQSDGFSCGLWALAFLEQEWRLWQGEAPQALDRDLPSKAQRLNRFIQFVLRAKELKAAKESALSGSQAEPEPPLPPPSQPPPDPPAGHDKPASPTYGCSRCNGSKTGCLDCNPAKMLRWAINKEKKDKQKAEAKAAQPPQAVHPEGKAEAKKRGRPKGSGKPKSKS